MNPILTIAGSDCSGGAGIQADLKTIMAHGAYGMSAITALTAQNTTGVFAVKETEPELIGAQLDAVFSDIPPRAVKIGMVVSAAAVHMISEKLCAYKAQNIVIDTVMVSTSGTLLMKETALQQAQEELFGMASLLTPNIQEAEILSAVSIQDEASMQYAAQIISQKFGCAVLCKGGHLPDAADDLLYANEKFYWMRARRMDNPNTHGTGCTLSAAIACNLAEGRTMPEAVQRAKAYVAEAILDGLDLGQGRGPLNHGYRIKV